MATAPLLTRRRLNRALLARQGLLERTAEPVTAVIERVLGLQGQDPDPPYVGLWCRIADFRRTDLESALQAGDVVRGMLFRGTQHLALPADVVRYRRLFDHLLEVQRRGAFGAATRDVDLDELTRIANDLLESGACRDRPSLGRALAQRWPDVPPVALARTAQHLVPMLHPPPDGLWGHRGATPLVLAESVLGPLVDGRAGPSGPPPTAVDLARRYLGAYGPASVADFRAFSGLTGGKSVFAALDPAELDVFVDEQGRTLYDLPDSPRPDADTPAPVRFLAALDNAVLAHDDRSRIVTHEQRKYAWAEATVTVDGFVRALWRFDSRKGPTTDLRIRTFSALDPTEETEVLAEGERLLRWAHGESAGRLAIEPLG